MKRGRSHVTTGYPYVCRAATQGIELLVPVSTLMNGNQMARYPHVCGNLYICLVVSLHLSPCMHEDQDTSGKAQGARSRIIQKGRFNFLRRNSAPKKVSLQRNRGVRVKFSRVWYPGLPPPAAPPLVRSAVAMSPGGVPPTHPPAPQPCARTLPTRLAFQNEPMIHVYFLCLVNVWTERVRARMTRASEPLDKIDYHL